MYIHKSGMLFQWDPDKSIKNIQKHGIDFSEAGTIWLDNYILTDIDQKHSALESRFIAIGMSINDRLITVVFTARSSTYEEKEIQYCRIINARSANAGEKSRYRENRQRLRD
ncbi:BrnT family toxin [Bdellovibrio sp. KM01]|uniref:BrnT family toxin n=1 Tax=Bdellovibrio sp. KM01 TaxID=2748865 RepID=UPI0015EA71B3|nr:BrnT family toxin [Bdellovibrio sp. KM01]